MQLFPYLLTRIGGGSYENLTQVDYSSLTGQAENLLARKAGRKQWKQDLCDRLLTSINALPDQRIQNQIQNLRRDIYNERPVKPQALAHARQHLPAASIAALDQYLAIESAWKAAQEKAGECYRDAVLRGRRHLQKLAQDENLQKGLVLSSQSLRNVLADYSSQDPGAFRKKEFQTEQSLLKYLTRMYTKTSPFSTFNNLALGTLGSLPHEAIEIGARPDAGPPVVGHIRLNNHLFRYLKDLFTASGDIYPHLLLRPNPTIADKGDHYVYLTNHNNVEAFQRIPSHPVVALVWQLTCARQAGIRFASLVQETSAYVEAPEENIAQYLRQLINYGFLEYDLGVSGTDPDWDLKLTTELAYLEQEQVAHISELSETLRYIRTLAAAYAQAPVAERQQILQDAYQAFRATCMQLHEAAGLPEMERRPPEALQAEWRAKKQQTAREKQDNSRKAAETVLVAEKEKAPETEPAEVVFEHRSSTYFSFKPEQLFYEDTIRQVAVQVDEGKLKELVRTLFNLLQELRCFRGLADERELMLHYFGQKYGAGARVNLLHFYEDFYREIKKPEAERIAKNRQQSLEKARQAPEQSPDPGSANGELPNAQNDQAMLPTGSLARQQHEKTKGRLEALVAALGDAPDGQPDQVHLSLPLLRQLHQAGADPEQEPVPANSYGAFVQLYREKDNQGVWQLKGVLNATTAGYGKMTSRFLHIFPGQVTQTLRAWNMDLQDENSLFIENCDASYFNANLHPPLMPYEIRMPGSHHSLPVEQQLAISDFEVRVDEAAGEVQLFHKPTGKRGYVFDLGFQGHGGRSQLFQLLDKFTYAEYLMVYPVVSAVNTAAENNKAGQRSNAETGQPSPEQIVVRPRIVYENQLVLQRKGWYVPKELIPPRQPAMSDWNYYLALNEWRKAQGMADEVYVTISPNRQPAAMDPELMKKLGRDDYKPQYINFNDPLLLHLFEKLLAKAPYTLKIEEMLPHAKDLLQLDNQRFVTEFVVQWYH